VLGDTPITNNGLPMTNGFDLAVYIKGDRKSTAIFDAQLEIEYEGGPVVPPPEVDVALTGLGVQEQVAFNVTVPITVTITNLTPDTAAAGVVRLVGVDQRADTPDYTFSTTFSGLLADPQAIVFLWSTPAMPPPDNLPQNVSWTATVEAVGDIDVRNDSATAQSQVVPRRQ